MEREKKLEENRNRGRRKVQEQKVEIWKKWEENVYYRQEHEGNTGHQREKSTLVTPKLTVNTKTAEEKSNKSSEITFGGRHWFLLVGCCLMRYRYEMQSTNDKWGDCVYPSIYLTLKTTYNDFR
jgi:hypothetical protein